MLTALRNSAQSWLIKGLLGLIVITFVISFGIGTFSNPKEVLVEVGDTEVLVSDFMRQYQQELERLRERFPDNADALAAQLNLRQQVLERIVNRHLLLQSARRQDLLVSEDEVKEAVTQQRTFQVNNRFDFETYRQILLQNRTTPADYEATLQQDLLLAKYQRNLIAGVIVAPAEVDQRFRIENERVEVDYVFVDPAKVRLPRLPSTEEQRAYYEAHPEQFTQPTQFQLRYFVLGLDALEEDVEIRDRAVERYYERNAEREFSTPGRVRASHILKRLPQGAGPEQEAKARGALEAVLAEARSGADFAKLARAHSQDSSAAKGGDLGLFTRDEMVPAFAEAAFALPKGGLSDIVHSPFGLHIIKVTEVEPGSRKSLDDVRVEIAAKLRAQRAERSLELELERLPARLAKEELDAVATSFGRQMHETPLFDDTAVLPGLGSAGPLYAQIAKLRQGEVGVWRRNPVQGHVFFRIVARKEAFVKALAAVQTEVANAAGAGQRRERSLTLAKDTFQKLQDGLALEAFAKSLSLAVRTVSFTVVEPSVENIGANPEFKRAAFGLTAAQPYALNIKEERAYLIRFRRRFYPQTVQEAQSKQRIAKRMQEAYEQYVLKRELDRLRAQVEVKVLAPQYVAANTTAPPARPAY